MAASVMNYHGSSSLRLTGGITKSRTKTVSRLEVANPRKLKNARKMLFGPVDRDETRRIVETQLKKHVLDATSRWGFDFTSDQPIRSPEAKYVWERVPRLDTEQSSSSSSSSHSDSPLSSPVTGPVLITLSSAAHVRTIDVVAMSPSSTASTLSSANSSLQSSPSTSVCNSDLESDLDLSSGVRSACGDLNSNDGSAATKRMVQKKMTDFMKEKKRTNAVLVTAAKKRLDDGSSAWGSEMPPAKRMRTGSAASTSSVGSSS